MNLSLAARHHVALGAHCSLELLMCRAILASKEPEQVADDLAAIIPHDEALPDILIVEDGPDTEQAGPADELSQQAASDNALALDEDMFGAAADSAAVVSYEAPQQTDVEYELAAGSPAYALRQDIADSAMEDSHMDTGNELMTTEMWRKPAIDEHAEEAHQADEHTFEHAESAQEPSDALAAEVAAVTDELVDIAIAEDQAVTAQLPPAEEEAVGAALEATLEGLVSTAETGKPDQPSAENLQTDAENVAAADFGNSEEAVDAEGESVDTINEGVPVLSIINSHTPHTAAIGPQESPEIQALSKSADTSVAEQQALANSILSGGDAQASPVASPVNDSLLHGEASAESNAATLDSLIGSKYQAKEFAAAQGSSNEAHDNAEPSTVDSQVTAGEGDSMEQGPTTDAAVNVSELQPAVQEDVQMPVTNSEEALTEEQQGNFAQAATSRAPIVMPVNGAEDVASPYAAADTGAVSTPEASLHEPSYADAIFPDTYTLAPGSDTDGLAAGSDTNTLATASDTEDAASPDAAADTKHDAPGASPLLKPSQEEMPSEAAALVTHDSVQVNLTLVSSSTVYSPAEEAEPAGARISANPQPIEDNGTKA